MFEKRTVEDVKSRVLERLTTGLQTREGSFTNDVISAAAAEICACYHSMDALLPAFYVDETSGAYIDRQASVVGVVRKAGAAANCAIAFTGADGAAVPAGTPFYTAAGLAFYLQEAVTVAEGAAQGVLTAAEPGELYNIGAGEIVSTLRNYPGIQSYANEAASGGTDPETDGALLARYHERMRRTATSGNPYHYQLWANSVDGVGASRVVSKWNGPGTVKIILADPEMEPASAEAVAAARAYIEDNRPVGPTVTVTAAEGREMAVEAIVSIDGTTTKEAVRTALEAALRGYLRDLTSAAFADNIDLQLETLAEKTYTVLYNRVAFLLLSLPGVVDYTSLTIGRGTANIPLAAGEVPVLTGVTVT